MPGLSGRAWHIRCRSERGLDEMRSTTCRSRWRTRSRVRVAAPRTTDEPIEPPGRLGAERQACGSLPVAQLAAHFFPGNCRARVGEMFVPTPIELGLLI